MNFTFIFHVRAFFFANSTRLLDDLISNLWRANLFIFKILDSMYYNNIVCTWNNLNWINNIYWTHIALQYYIIGQNMKLHTLVCMNLFQIKHINIQKTDIYHNTFCCIFPTDVQCTRSDVLRLIVVDFSGSILGHNYVFGAVFHTFHCM